MAECGSAPRAICRRTMHLEVAAGRAHTEIQEVAAVHRGVRRREIQSHGV
eukprot:CAMPEP_0203906884 /NCGR_PEP_ID=MMETSP0359-20131031/48449_1 /ASSEMBLY_ACC=CAM_ASM_000338 /TAXON_ID=268821 /ORGANISM="Scrippsiella Hangoei, Strain SHTV-5" /LENGTH=49 /DNA_ID= /DNA_START= /DNA_END= /DNA_ORIENTATION=